MSALFSERGICSRPGCTTRYRCGRLALARIERRKGFGAALPAPHHIAAVDVFDFQDIRAELGQMAGRERSRDDMRDIDDLDACQWLKFSNAWLTFLVAI